MDDTATIKRMSRFGDGFVLNEHGKPVDADPDRHVELLSFLERNRYATFKDMLAYLKGDPTSLRRAIRVLKAKNNGYIKVCEQDIDDYNLRKPVHYELDRNGIDYLRRVGMVVPERKSARNFTHAALASHGTAQIEAGIAAAENARLISWAEILSSPNMPAESKKADHPSGMRTSYTVHKEKFDRIVYADTPPFGIELTIDGRKKFRFFPGIEADTGTEPITTADFERSALANKFRAYLAIEENETYRSHFGFPLFFVPFLFKPGKEHRMKGAMAELERMTGGKGSKTLTFAVARQDAPAGYLFIEGWQRVSYSPIVLAK